MRANKTKSICIDSGGGWDGLSVFTLFCVSFCIFSTSGHCVNHTYCPWRTHWDGILELINKILKQNSTDHRDDWVASLHALLDNCLRLMASDAWASISMSPFKKKECLSLSVPKYAWVLRGSGLAAGVRPSVCVCACVCVCKQSLDVLIGQPCPCAKPLMAHLSSWSDQSSYTIPTCYCMTSQQVGRFPGNWSKSS